MVTGAASTNGVPEAVPVPDGPAKGDGQA
jgi:hypothetical protein